MRDHDGGAPLADHSQRTLDGRLGLVVHGAGGLVQDKHLGVFENGACQGQTLALAARELLAPLAQAGGKAQRQLFDEFGGLGGARGLGNGRIADARGVLLAIGNVVRHAGVAQKSVLRHIANGAAQVLQIQRVYGLAVQQNPALLGRVKAQQQLDQGGFSRAGRPYKSRRLAGGNRQVDGAERRRLARAGIGKAQVFHADFALHMVFDKVLALVGDVDGRGQEPHGPLDRRHRALVHIGHLGQARHGPKQALGQKHQHRESTHRQLTMQSEPAAVEQGRRKAGQDGHTNHRRDGRAHPDGRRIRGAVTVAGLFDVLGLKALGRKGLDGRQAQQVVIEPRAYIARCLAHLRIARRQAALKPKCAKQNQRHRQQRNHRNARLQRKKYRANHDRGAQHLDDLVGPAVQKALHLVDVVVQNGHQIAGALGLKIRHIQALHMAVGVQAHSVLEVLRELAPFHLQQILKHRFTTPHQYVKERQRQQLLPGVADAQAHQHVPGQKALFAFDHHIHRRTNEHLGQDVEKFVDYRIQRRELKVAAVGAGVAQELGEWMHLRAGQPGLAAQLGSHLGHPRAIGEGGLQVARVHGLGGRGVAGVGHQADART